MATERLTQRGMQARYGISQSHISKRLSLLLLPHNVQQDLTQGVLTIQEALTMVRESMRAAG